MPMYKKAIGCIFMILGTTTGIGMLALPVVTAHENFTLTILLLCFSWLIMTIGAYSLLEVNLWLPSNTNMISMAEKTLGTFGKVFTWVIYLLLLYSLLCAYLSAISGIIQGLCANNHIILPRWVATVLGLLLFSFIVYKGIGAVDIVNRGLMSIKLMAYLLVVALVTGHVNTQTIFAGDYTIHNSVLMVMLTSFGYAVILPSLRHYLDSNKPLLKKVVCIGSLLPLIIYALWIFVIQGFIPKEGPTGLISMITATNTNALLMQSISAKVHIGWVAHMANFFISICAVTSFLGVSVCLTDFIADGLNIKKQGTPGLAVQGICFLPPLLIVLLSPGIFIQALNYAGLFCLLLLIILPLIMLYRGRYRLGMHEHTLLPYGKSLILGSLTLGIVLFSVNVALLKG